MSRWLPLVLSSTLTWAGAQGCPPPQDADQDGFTVDAGDCDDGDAGVHPAADERCDAAGIDEDCDGLEGADDPSVVDADLSFVDADGDGYGDPAGALVTCGASPGGIGNGQDCDDTSAALNPGTSCAGTGVIVLSPDGGDGSGYGFDSIQAALDGASPGDIIYLEGGTYYANLSFPRKAVSLWGVALGQVTIDGSGCVDGEARCSVLRFDWQADGGSMPPGRATVGQLVFTGGLGTSGAELGEGLGRTYGGAVAIRHANPALISIDAWGNEAGRGGALWVNNSTASLSNIHLHDNDAETGGGAYVSFSEADFTDLVAQRNRATTGGGLAYDNAGGRIDGLTLLSNQADYGAGFNLTLSSPRISAANISGNTAQQLGGGMYLYDSLATFDGLSLNGNRARSGAGLNATYASPLISGLIAQRNRAVEYGGALYLYEGSPTITGADISSNEADVGAGIFISYAHPRITGAWMEDNHATGSGGALYASSSRARLTNAVLTGNSSGNKGGGIYESYSDLTLTNITVAHNSAPDGGGMFMHFNSAPTLDSSIFAFNEATISGANLFVHQSSEPVLLYNLAYDENTEGAGFEGDIPTATLTIADPLFTNPPGDYHLAPGSPAINGGNPSPTHDDPDGSRNDMGAYGGPDAASQ